MQHMMTRNVPIFHSVIFKLHLTVAALCGMVLSAPAQADENAASSEQVAAEGNIPSSGASGYVAPLPRDYRPLATFGVTVGIQTFGVLTAALLTGTVYGFSDRAMKIGWGVVAGCAPAIGGTVAWAVGGTSRVYNSPIGGIIAGAYLGAAMGYLATFFTLQKDNPEVDGRYDPIYFGQNRGSKVLINIAAYGLAPVFLPAVGAAVGHLITRKALNEDRRISLGPPYFWMRRSPARAGALDFGMQLVSASF